MGSFSLVHWLLVGAVVLLLFGGRGKISDLMGDVAKGIKSFKKGLSDDESQPTPPPVETAKPTEPMRTIDHQPQAEVKKAGDGARIG
jgi:sec-independent protein translocase protein TatA